MPSSPNVAVTASPCRREGRLGGANHAGVEGASTEPRRSAVAARYRAVHSTSGQSERWAETRHLCPPVMCDPDCDAANEPDRTKGGSEHEPHPSIVATNAIDRLESTTRLRHLHLVKRHEGGSVAIDSLTAEWGKTHESRTDEQQSAERQQNLQRSAHRPTSAERRRRVLPGGLSPPSGTALPRGDRQAGQPGSPSFSMTVFSLQGGGRPTRNLQPIGSTAGNLSRGTVQRPDHDGPIAGYAPTGGYGT